MATRFNFSNKIIKLPGAYATIVSGGQTTPLDLSYGKVVVIDTGDVGASWGGGAGVDGELNSGKDSVYKFNNLADYQDFLKGGLFYTMADALFKPDKLTGALGVSEVIHAKAATTVAATMTFTATGGGAAGGTFKFKVRDEGVIGNGVLTSTHLDKGYAYTIVPGVVDTAKWILKVWRGTWAGNHTDGVSFNEIPKADTVEKIITSSPEFDNIQDLIDWATENSNFNTYFKLDITSAVVGDGSIDSDDVTAVAGFQVAVGGTESYTSANLDLILNAIAEEQYSFIIIDKYGPTNYQDADVTKVISYNLADAKFKAGIYYGGGKDVDEFSSVTGSLAQATYFNSAYVHVIHGDIGEASSSVGEGFRRWPSIIHSAKMLGRMAGKEPQVPGTNKTIGVDKLYHSLTKSEKERALDAGVLTTIQSNSIGRPVILQAVNTLQDNTRIFTPQGQSHQISSMRIIEQLNAELVVNAESSLLNDENGVNLNTLSANQIKDFTETYLQSKVASTADDNLIIDFRNITVTLQGDAWLVNYEVVINSEINKVFFTGFIVS